MIEESLFAYFSLLGVFFKYTWWFLLPISLYAIFKSVWQKFIVNSYFAEKIDLKLLHIKIPRDLLMNPKAMESVLAGLSGTGRNITVHDGLIKGTVQDFFSFEIAGNEGEMGFYVQTPKRSQVLIEKLFYSQFPGVEIAEVEDYTKAVPSTIPDENWNLWGGKYILEKGQERPITTYPSFEDRLTGELVDPLSGLFEVMGTLGPGEHLWLQIQVVPAIPTWKQASMKKIDEILKKYNMGGLADVSESTTVMKVLPHHELELIKSIHLKMAKPGFNTQILFAYIARKEHYRDIIPGIIGGVFKQFENGDINGFLGDKYYTTSTFYLASASRRDYRKRRLIDMLKDRDMQGETPVLNSEEIATIFHFPTPTVQIPSLPRLDSKTAPAPSNLPISD